MSNVGFSSFFLPKLIWSSDPLGVSPIVVEKYERDGFEPSMQERHRPPQGSHGLVLCTTGVTRGQYAVNGGGLKDYVNVSGTILLYGADASDVVNKPDNQVSTRKAEYIGVHFSPEVLHSAVELTDQNSVSVNLPHALTPRDPVLESLIKAIGKAIGEENPDSSLYCDTATQFLCVHLLTYYCNRPLRGAEPKLVPAEMRKVIDFIHAELHRSISLDDLANLACISKYHFSRSFRQIMGVAPHQYLLQRRIERAKHLLQTSRLSLQEIVREVGYADVSAFSRLFKRNTSVSPTVFRRSISALDEC